MQQKYTRQVPFTAQGDEGLDVQAWEELGYVDVPCAIDLEYWERLTVEANTLRHDAIMLSHLKISALRDGSLRSATHYRLIAGGSELVGLLRSRELLLKVRRLTGISTLVPVRCGFNYYECGDYIGIHRDAIRSTVTVTFALTPNIGPMNWLPALRRESNDIVADFIVQNGPTPARGSELAVGYRALRAFDGYNIPHWRRPFTGQLGILASLSFFDL